MKNPLCFLLALCAPAGLAAQTPVTATDSAPPVPPPAPRAAWFSDRLPVRVGDLVTIVVDEATTASERVSTAASADRGQRARLGAGVDEDVRLGPAMDFNTGLQSSSRDVGEAARRGQLAAVLTVRVVSIDAAGIATVEGAKKVMVDGRTQQVELKGRVRAEDISAGNLVSSSRIADAEITYSGKKIGPRTGILGKLLSIFWP